MSNSSTTGLDRRGLDDTFAADEVRKSNLILEGRLLEARQQLDEAAQKFAQAAEYEERLGNQCVTLGLSDRASLHLYSAASCWARAGNFFRAIALCDDLLRRSGLPDALRRQIENYVHVLRGRRAQWAAELTLAPATVDV
jgi:tetratricopeptide (TPR) repeat protein